MNAGSSRPPVFQRLSGRHGASADHRGSARGVPLGVEIAAYLVCGMAGFVFGFEFGHQVTGGWGLGVVTGLMGVLFCTILASAVLAWVERRLGAAAAKAAGRPG